jgi:hypothetical protein
MGAEEGTPIAAAAEEEEQGKKPLEGGDEESGEGDGGQPEGEGSDVESGEEGEEGKGKAPVNGRRKRGAEERIKGLTRSVYGLVQQNQQLMQKVEALTKQVANPPAAAKPKPKEEDFDSQAEFIEALTDWKVEQATKKTPAAEPPNPQNRQNQQGEGSQDGLSDGIMGTFRDQEKVARAKYDDYDLVVNNPSVPVSRAMMELVLTSPVGAELAYHLGSNIQEADRISRLPPTRAAVELGKLEAKLEAEVKAEAKGGGSEEPGTRASAGAPAQPISPVGGRRGGPKTLKDMSMEEYIRTRNEQERQRRR